MSPPAAPWVPGTSPGMTVVGVAGLAACRQRRTVSHSAGGPAVRPGVEVECHPHRTVRLESEDGEARRIGPAEPVSFRDDPAAAVGIRDRVEAVAEAIDER